MEKEIIINVADNRVLTSSEEVLVEVRGRPPSRGDHVILASGSQIHQQQQQQLLFKSEPGLCIYIFPVSYRIHFVSGGLDLKLRAGDNFLYWNVMPLI